MRFFLLLLSICGTVSQLSAQSVFGQVYGSSSFDHVYSMATTSTNNVALAGEMDGAAWLVCLNAQDDTLWTRRYPSGRRFNTVLATPDGGFFATGEGYQAKVDAAGVIEWSLATPTIYGIDAVPTANGGYLIAGYTNDGNGTPNHGLLLELSATGALLWDRAYPPDSTFGCAFIRLLKTSNGDLTVLRSSIPVGLTSFYATVQLEHYSPLGQLLSTDTTAYKTYSAATATDGGLLLLLINRIPTPSYRILKKDSHGQDVWTHALSSIHWNRVHATPDGGCIVIGNQLNGDGQLAKLDASGNREWSTVLPDSLGDAHFRSLALAANGDYLLAGGYVQDSGTYNMDGYFLRVNSQGEYIGVQTPPMAKGITFFPNPTPSTLNIYPTQPFASPLHIELVNLQGQVLRSLRLNTAPISVDVQGWPKGVYLIRVFNEREKTLQTYPMIKG